jgi:shikimate kinase
MGTGKTSAGKRVAQRLHMRFVDMDSLIARRAGKPVNRIFAEDGEPRFRAMERDLVRELAAKGGLVVGAGGGIVLNPDNVSDYARTGLVVCLTATPEAILRRLARDTTRPLLAGEGDKLAKITALLEKRRPLYEAIELRIDTSDLSSAEVADRIVALYSARCPGPDAPPAGGSPPKEVAS